METHSTGKPSQGVIDSIVDLTSATSSMAFFGKVTKPCKVLTKNATVCTISEILRNKDRDIRIRVEISSKSVPSLCLNFLLIHPM
jgi:hypothetical protein